MPVSENPLGPAPEKASPWGALLQVITEPTRTFERFHGRPAILPGYLLQMVLSMIGFALMYPVTMAMVEQQITLQGAPPEQMALAKTAGMVTGLTGALVAPWIAGLLVSLLAMFFGQFHRGEATFTGYFGMVGYARIPMALATLLQSILVAVVGQQGMTMSLSLAVLAPDTVSPYLKTILGAVNPFSIWYYILLAIGFGVLNRTRPAKATTMVVTLVILNLLVAMVGVAIGKAFAPNMM
ncbi:MAG TPA: Yip1 family protein [Symbiobacteriaceae bacterium]|nr:Yip1 family protein [Symbiobacteriaceae bacterium]